MAVWGLLPPLVGGLACLVLASGVVPPLSGLAFRLAGWVGVALAALITGAVAFQIRQPRLAYASGQLLVYARRGGPLAVPIQLVEGFLLGQGPAYVDARKPDRFMGKNLVIRLDEKAEEYATRSVIPALGQWCGGYITLRGAWCEPLDVAVVTRLNERLARAKESLASSAGASR